MTAHRDEVDRIADIARARGIRIAAAESLTSGKLASTLGAGADAEKWFSGAVVAYRTDVKEHVLDLRPGVDPCSSECAEQLAAGARRLLLADVAISTTGVGGPDPEGGHEPGTVYLGWATAESVGHRPLRLKGDPAEVLRTTIDHALDVLAELLENAPEPVR